MVGTSLTRCSRMMAFGCGSAQISPSLQLDQLEGSGTAVRDLFQRLRSPDSHPPGSARNPKPEHLGGHILPHAFGRSLSCAGCRWISILMNPPSNGSSCSPL